MNEMNNIFKSFSFFRTENMISFNNKLEIVFNKGFEDIDIEEIKRSIQSLSNKEEQIIQLSINRHCKLNEININIDTFYLVIEIPSHHEIDYSDSFLQESSKFLDALNTDIVVMKNKKVIFRNKNVLKLLGLSESSALQAHQKFQTKKSLENFEKFLNSKKSGEIILEVVNKDGKVNLVKTAISYILFNGEGYHVSLVKDIKQIKEIEDKYVAEIDYLRHTIRVIDEGVIVLNSMNLITMFNKAATNITGIAAIDAFDKNVEDLIEVLDEDKNIIEYINEDKYNLKNAYLNRKDGLLWNIAFSIDSIKNDSGEYLGKVLTIVDISDIKRREEEILYLSYHDVLTGLYNRTYLEDAIRRLDTSRQVPFSIIMGDVNGLKMTNDVFGHDEGDNLLRNVSKILKKISRSEDIIGRWGGDEFIILLPKTSEEEAYMITKRIIRSFEDIDDSYNIKGILPSISLGYGVKNSEDTTIYDVLKTAESNMYKRKMLSKESIHSAVIASMKTTLHEKSHETEEHSNRLYETCMKVAIHYDLNSSDFSDLELLCMLHDVGKIGIPDGILKYPGPLSNDQWEEMKTHSEIGYRIALTTPGLEKVANYILSHHEHYDGSGYPKGLAGDKIPLLNRILAVADSFDAMTNDRVYKKGISKEKAFIELENCSGSQFDPEIVALFIQENDIDF